MSNCKAQLAPKKVTEQDTNFGIDSTHIGKSAPKKDVKIIPSKIDVSAKKNEGRTKDLVKESLLEIREVVKKKQIFYGQADRKGGGRSAPPRPDRSICENFRT